MTPEILLECCLEGVESVKQALHGGAHRVELCSNLAQGGTTPSIGDVECSVVALKDSTTRIHVLVRPRPGNFVYTNAEVEVMRRDIEAIKHAGAQGVVIGALRSDGAVDEETIAMLVAAAAPALSVTFHRAFDCCLEPLQALQTLMRLGVDRLLTSGQASTAWEGRELIKTLVEQACGRIVVMPGAGVTEHNIWPLLEHTGAVEAHVGSACHEDIFQSGLVRLGCSYQGNQPPIPCSVPACRRPSVWEGDEHAIRRVSAQKVGALVKMIQCEK